MIGMATEGCCCESSRLTTTDPLTAPANFSAWFPAALWVEQADEWIVSGNDERRQLAGCRY